MAPAAAADGAPSSGFGNGGTGFGQKAQAGEAEQPTAPNDAAAEAAPDAEAPQAGPAEPQAMMAAAATSSSEDGEDSAAAPGKVDLPNSGGNGNLSYAIGIDVTPFRGLEPSITLNYNSSRKTKLSGLYQGWLGHAWGLDGFDVIERASPGYGMPAFDATDIYLLNGEALVACGSGVSSPSCSAGGSHATEIESYRRIAFNSSGNEWKVTDRDGTVSTFRSVAALANANPAAGTPAYDLERNYRWLLSSVIDTHGNTVSYAYDCPQRPVCYPNTVSYNGTTIKFYREARPDVLLMGNGLDLSETRFRLNAITVSVGTALRSAYQLQYDQAPFSNSSRLTKVVRFGNDAAVDAAGVITGPTSKSVGQMTYQNVGGTSSYTLKTGLTYQAPSGSSPALNASSLFKSVSDLNFDGRDELIGSTYPRPSFIIRYSTLTLVEHRRRLRIRHAIQPSRFQALVE